MLCSHTEREMVVAGHHHPLAILTPEKSRGTHRTRGWSGHRASQDRCEEDMFTFSNEATEFNSLKSGFKRQIRNCDTQVSHSYLVTSPVLHWAVSVQLVSYLPSQLL
jgi:hypothetical protein